MVEVGPDRALLCPFDYLTDIVYTSHEALEWSGKLSRQEVRNPSQQQRPMPGRHPQGIAAVGFASRAGDPLRVDHQRENGQGARRDYSRYRPRSGPRGDGVKAGR